MHVPVLILASYSRKQPPHSSHSPPVAETGDISCVLCPVPPLPSISAPRRSFMP